MSNKSKQFKLNKYHPCCLVVLCMLCVLLLTLLFSSRNKTVDGSFTYRSIPGQTQPPSIDPTATKNVDNDINNVEHYVYEQLKAMVKNSSIEKDVYSSEMYYEWFDHSNLTFNISIEPYCLHFLNVKFSNTNCDYTIKYDINSDIIKNYYSLNQFWELSKKHRSVAMMMKDLCKECASKHPILKHENNIEYYNSSPDAIDIRHWQKRMTNKTILYIGDSVGRRLGQEITMYLSNSRNFSDVMEKKFKWTHRHWNVTRFNFNMFELWAPCINEAWDYIKATNKKPNGKLWELFDWNDKKIDYVIVMVCCYIIA